MYDFERLLKSFELAAGRHSAPDEGLCVMEAVAWLEGLSHSDRPDCTCPVIAECVTVLNDWMDEETRQGLVPYLPRLAGTVSKPHERARAEFAVLQAARKSLPLVAGKIGFDAAPSKAARTLGEARPAIDAVHGHTIWRGVYESAAALRLAPFIAALKTALHTGDRIGMAGASAAIIVVTANMRKEFAPCFGLIEGLLAIGPAAGFSSDVAERAHAYRRMSGV